MLDPDSLCLNEITAAIPVSAGFGVIPTPSTPIKIRGPVRAPVSHLRAATFALAPCRTHALDFVVDQSSPAAAIDAGRCLAEVEGHSSPFGLR